MAIITDLSKRQESIIAFVDAIRNGIKSFVTPEHKRKIKIVQGNVFSKSSLEISEKSPIEDIYKTLIKNAFEEFSPLPVTYDFTNQGSYSKKETAYIQKSGKRHGFLKNNQLLYSLWQNKNYDKYLSLKKLLQKNTGCCQELSKYLGILLSAHNEVKPMSKLTKKSTLQSNLQSTSGIIDKLFNDKNSHIKLVEGTISNNTNKTTSKHMVLEVSFINKKGEQEVKYIDPKLILKAPVGSYTKEDLMWLPAEKRKAKITEDEIDVPDISYNNALTQYNNDGKKYSFKPEKAVELTKGTTIEKMYRDLYNINNHRKKTAIEIQK